MSRQFITKTEIDRLLDDGQRVLEVDAHTTVTDLAREYAMRRGLSIVRANGTSPIPAPVDGVAEADELHAKIRSGVIAALKEVPAGLDAAIDKVIAAR